MNRAMNVAEAAGIYLFAAGPSLEGRGMEGNFYIYWEVGTLCVCVQVQRVGLCEYKRH